MSLIQDFKKFATRGNIVDLATGVILGAAFGKIVTSLVENILMPPIGYILSGLNFSELAITLRAATESRPAVVIGYGKFIQSSIDFLIVSLCIFAMLRGIQKLQRSQPAVAAPPPAPTGEERLLAEIRDLLARQQQYMPR